MVPGGTAPRIWTGCGAGHRNWPPFPRSHPRACTRLDHPSYRSPPKMAERIQMTDRRTCRTRQSDHSHSSKAMGSDPTSGPPLRRVFDVSVAKAYDGNRQMSSGSKFWLVRRPTTQTGEWLPEATDRYLSQPSRRDQGSADHSDRWRYPFIERGACDRSWISMCACVLSAGMPAFHHR